MGPTGYSIVHLSMVDDRAMHVAVAFNGGVLYDNSEDRSAEYGQIMGFFILYDLEFPKAKWIKKSKKRKK